MASAADSSPEAHAQGSVRGPLLIGHLLLALVLGLAAVAAVHQLLLRPLQRQELETQREFQAHVLDNLRSELAHVRHYAAAFNALARTHWGDTTQTRRLAESLLGQIPLDSAIVGAGIWPEPRSFDRRQERYSLYWTLPRTDGSSAPALHNDYNDPQRISYFGEIWYAPLRWATTTRCHFSRRFEEPFLQRELIACSIPVTIDGRFAGVTSLVVDPNRWPLSGLRAPTDAPPGQFQLLLDDELQVIRAAGIGATAADDLPTLGQRDPRFGPPAVYLHEQTQSRTRALQDDDPQWQDKVAQLSTNARQLSERQAAQLLSRMVSSTTDTGMHRMRVLTADGQRNELQLIPLPDFGTLIFGRVLPPGAAGFSVTQLAALAAVLAAPLLGLLMAYALSARKLIRPLRHILDQLQRPAEDTVLETSGRTEIAHLASQLNQRHERIRQLLQRGNGRAGGRRPAAQPSGSADAAGDAAQILEAFADAVVLTDAQGRIAHFNAAAEALCGWTLEAARGLDFDEVFHLSDRRGKKRLAQLPARTIKAGRRTERPLAVQFTTRSGHHLPLAVSGGPYRGADQADGALLVLHDNRNNARAGAQEPQAAARDPLTGVLNRQAFDAELDARCEATRIGGEAPFHLLYVDIDGLSRINGSFGTDAGDELLRQLSRLIQSDVGERNPVYRLFGDKFGIMLDTAESAEAQVTAELLRADAQSWGFRWNGETSEISLSVGLVKVDRESGRPVDILRSVGELCDRAQTEGGGKVLLGEARSVRPETRDDRYWLNNIKRGLAEDRFHLSTQQIKPMQRDLEAAGEVFDTLMLLEDEEGFWTEAKVFMPIAQSHDLATQLDRWTFEHIFRKLHQDEALYEKLDFCLISVSPNSTQNMGFLDFLMEKFQETGIARSKICIDLQEQHVQRRISSAKEFCQALARAGCRLSLSGASTQPASYKLIRDLPVQLVRIDPVITRNAAKDPLDRLATESLHRIVHAMDKRSMAVGIDSPEQLRVMQGIGIDYAQGDAVARTTPMLFQAQA